VLRNRLEHVLAWWALHVVGAAAVSVNFRLSAGELRYVLEDSGACVALFESGPAAAVQEAARGRDVRLVGVGDGLSGATQPFGDLAHGVASPGADETSRTIKATDLPPITENDLSLILYTSGTTGRPKGVPRTHGNGAAGALAHVVQCGYTWGERTLGAMPLYHTMGVHALTSMAAINGCFACQPEWSPEGALQLIETRGLSALYLIPTLFYDLVHAPTFARERVRSVRKLGYAGAPMLAPLTNACVAAFRPDTFVNHYGSTEIYTFSVRANVASKPGCAGRPGLHSRLRVVEASTDRRVGPDETVEAGTKGEIIASLDSDEAFAGYWNRPDADARALRDGWYFTGDMGYVDGEGELWVAGRVDDMIISGGENIHPVEVENVVARHPGVRDVAVVGAPHPRWGEQVVAFVVRAEDTVDGDTLDAHCRASHDLAGFKRPRQFVFVAEIPKTASGKILRRLLRDGQYTEITS
jgi:2-furoate---CoA ligase